MTAANEEIWRKVCGIMMHHLGLVDVNVTGEDIAQIPDTMCVVLGGGKSPKDLRVRLMTTKAAQTIGAQKKPGQFE